jgi:5'-3' exonuclease
MGIIEFLSCVLDSVGRPLDLRAFADGIFVRGGNNNRGLKRPMRIGIDVSSWIYKAARKFGDERQLTNYGRACLLEEQETAVAVQEYVNACTQYVMKRLVTLRDTSKADCLVVLDGATPPCKTKEVTPGLHYTAIVTQLLQELRSQLMPFLIAPYQAGSQLAYMSHRGYINLIITEDSTMVAHGAASILYKSVEELGNGQPKGILLQSSDIGSVSSLNLLDFSDAMVAVLCVALGCDYCDTLKRIGLVTASRIIRKAFLEPRSKETHPSALHVVLEELYKHVLEQLYELIDTTGFTDELHDDYQRNFLAALLMYRHPIVFDPFAPACVTVALDKPDADLMDHPDYYKFAPACVTVGLDKPDADLMDHLDNYKFAPACVTVGLDEPDADLMDHLDYYKLVMDVNQRSLVIGIVPPAATATAMAEGQQFTSPNKTTTTTTTTTIMSSSDKEDAPVAAQQVEDLSSSEDDDLFQEPAEEEATTTSAKNEYSSARMKQALVSPTIWMWV